MNNVTTTRKSTVYPGEFTSLIKEDALKELLELAHKNEDYLVMPPVNVKESTNFFTVEVVIPGISREELLVFTDEQVISVFVMNEASKDHAAATFTTHEFKDRCFGRHIILPKSADTEFTCAEYKTGILYLFIPKGENSTGHGHTQIVVY
ncbi:MAG: Hsp20/alpha crystallin family protein [Bacteroidota bacterium]|nr:Hsp20/alpha crystallin family protein [Bacteroidota bacterium]